MKKNKIEELLKQKKQIIEKLEKQPRKPIICFASQKEQEEYWKKETELAKSLKKVEAEIIKVKK